MTKQETDTLLNKIKINLQKRLEKHGPRPYNSRHETLGIITEEYTELCNAICNDESHEEFSEELMDVAVACIFGIYSLEQKDTNETK